MTEIKFIDVEKILKDKAPSLEKWLPGFAKRYLRKKLHEEEINHIMHTLQDVHGLEFNDRGLEMLGVKIESVNAHNIPKTGGIILASNHPLGGLDGMAFVKTIGEIRKDVHFVVNDVLKSLKNYGDVFIGVNKIKSTSHGSLRSIENVLNTDETVAFFPAGLVSRKENGLIRDLEWKKSFVTQAIDHKRLIVPVYINGENSKFFYRFANLRKRIGIKANIEMLFLPDEMFKQKGKTVRVHFGKPFDPAILDKSRTHKAWAHEIKQYVYSQEFKDEVPFEEYMNMALVK